MSQFPAFSISGLSCGYGNGPEVLRIDHLEIPSQKLIFVIGPSGSGKSTLIETLGLMNRTIRNSDSVKMLLNLNGVSIDLSKSWHEPRLHRAHLRRTAFSFLFQSTNLMPNFSAGENMCVALLMQGVDIQTAKEHVLKLMPQLDLDPEIFERSTTELSGGQRQRVAFIRAFVGSYAVLFGDEPTGNLDRGTAFKLLEILKQETVAKAGKTCIIVSHDLELAQLFADMIIPIHMTERSDGGRLGFVNQEQVYQQDGEIWKMNGNEVINIKDTLKDIIINTQNN